MIQANTIPTNNHAIATAFHDAGTKKVVIFCHGYRGTSVGPSRFFVRAAEKLLSAGVSSLRFDQYGSGNSDGDFYDSSFTDWIATTKAIATDYINKGYEVALFGQSMGGSTVLVAGAELEGIASVVAWVPDASIDELHVPESGYMEEGGQRVKALFWQEAHGAHIAQKLSVLKAPAYIVQCTADEYVDKANQDAIKQHAQSNHTVVSCEGYPHSSWSFEQAEQIITDSVDFIVKQFNA